MISHNEFDTVYHEHLSYFLVNSFSRLVERKDLLIVDILKTPIHGGSIRFFLTKNKGKHSPIVASLIQYEKEKGLLEVSSYTNFSKRIKKNKKEMKLLFKRLEGDGKKVIGYAASAKGNTMLNYFKIRPQYIVDDNPLKCGLLTPGMNIPIVPSSTLKEEKGRLYIIVLAWNFYNEIVERIEIMRPGKDDYGILYVPDVKVLPLGDNKNISVSA